MFTAAALRSMCRLEQRALRDVPHFEDLCERNRRNECCRSWSIGNYVALLKNRSSCNDITNEDVQNVRATLKLCAKFYYSLQLHSDCYKDGRLSSSCRRIPLDCVKHNAVYNMLYFLSDFWFLNPKFPGTENSSLTYAVSFLPMACSSAALPYFEGLHRGDFSDGVTQVVAMELGLKNVLFDQYLVNDTVFVGLAAGVILIFMWMYTSSFFITVMTLVAIAFSLGIAYFLYTLIFKIKFFPFMNLLTSVIIVGEYIGGESQSLFKTRFFFGSKTSCCSFPGIGADDAFIYCKVWASAKSEKNNGTLVKLVHDTLHHAVPSMFVTSLTTAAAFFASYVSNITAIRCFR